MARARAEAERAVAARADGSRDNLEPPLLSPQDRQDVEDMGDVKDMDITELWDTRQVLIEFQRFEKDPDVEDV